MTEEHQNEGDAALMGRPCMYATNAERQRAYRQRHPPRDGNPLRKVGRPRVWPDDQARKHAWYMRKLSIEYGWPRDSFWAADVIRVALRLPVPRCFCARCRKAERPAEIVIPFGPKMVTVVQQCVTGGSSVAFLAERLNVSHGVIRACVALAELPARPMRRPMLLELGEPREMREAA